MDRIQFSDDSIHFDAVWPGWAWIRFGCDQIPFVLLDSIRQLGCDWNFAAFAPGSQDSIPFGFNSLLVNGSYKNSLSYV